MIKIDKREFRFPGNSSAGIVSGIPIPGPAQIGAFAYPVADAGTFTGVTAPLPFTLAGQKIDLLRNPTPIQAISIAPDSAIGTCDLWLAGDDVATSRRRISPGVPLIEDLSDYDFAYITIPSGLSSPNYATTMVVA